jgi:hypothetical protein
MLIMPPPKKPSRSQRPSKKEGDKPIPPDQKPTADESGGDKPNRSGKAVNIWVGMDVYAALERFRSAQKPFKPTKTDVVELALIEFLKREGFPPEAGADQTE